MNIREIRNIIVAGIFLFSFELFLFSQSPVELNKEGIKLGNKKKYNEAMKKFNQSAAIFDKVSAGVYYNRGLAQEKVKNIGGAIASYQEVIKRDPSHANGHGRLGFWLFKQGNYPEAIKRGEKSLELKPGNKVVIKWLVQAYAKNLEKKRKDKIPKAPKKGGEEKKKTLAQVAREKKKPKIFYVAFDMSFIEKYEIENEGFQFHSEEGKLVNLPMEVHFWVKPTPLFVFKFDSGYPYLGASIPNIINQYEKFEAVFTTGFFSIGAGLLISHYQEDINFNSQEALYDLKPGLLLGFKIKKSIFDLSVYPRYPYDGSNKSDISFDAAQTELKYTYLLNKDLYYYSRISFYDYYFTSHDLEISNYWGYYEVVIGATLVKDNIVKAGGIAVSFELGKRVNLEKLGADDPYQLINGQGYFGYDRDPEDGEKRFNGYQSISNIFNFSLQENIGDRFFLYQKLKIEIVDRHEEEQVLLFLIGAGFTL